MNLVHATGRLVLAFLRGLVGYVSEARALDAGLTHHGSYHGLPIYIGAVDSDNPRVYAKYDLLEWLLPVISCLEMFFQVIVHAPPEACGFMFTIKAPIDPQPAPSAKS